MIIGDGGLCDHVRSFFVAKRGEEDCVCIAVRIAGMRELMGGCQQVVHALW